jgi:hypothetical protein
MLKELVLYRAVAYLYDLVYQISPYMEIVMCQVLPQCADSTKGRAKPEGHAKLDKTREL